MPMIYVGIPTQVSFGAIPSFQLEFFSSKLFLLCSDPFHYYFLRSYMCDRHVHNVLRIY